MTMEWRLLAQQHDLVRLKIVGAIVSERQALSGDGEPAVAPVAELLVHSQVAGGCGKWLELGARAAI